MERVVAERDGRGSLASAGFRVPLLDTGVAIMRFASLIGLGLIAFACGPKSDTPAASAGTAAAATLSGATLDSVKAVDAAWAAGMNAKDTAAVLAVYAEDARLLPPDAPIMDKASARAVLAGFIAGGASDFVLTPTIVYGVGDLAYMVGTADFKMGGASETVKYTDIVRRGADGKWRYVVDMFSGVAAPPAAAATKKK
jgi:ketosteroid isomerase-like protein